MSSDKNEDGNHKKKLLFLNKKSIYDTNLHKKGKK